MANTVRFQFYLDSASEATAEGKSYYWRVEESDGDYDADDGSLEQPEEGVNYFILSEGGELSYHQATGEGALIFGEENKLNLYIVMNDYLKFSIANGLQTNVTACEIHNVGDGAELTGLGEGYTIEALPYPDGTVTVNNIPFVGADYGMLNLRMVMVGETPEAVIENGSVVLSKDNGKDKYSGSEGGSVTYDYTGDEQGETAVATFEEGTASSITGMDKVGETVTVTSKDNVVTTYERTAYGLKRTIGVVSSFCTGDVSDETNVLNLPDSVWSDSLALTEPTFSLTLGNIYYEVTMESSGKTLTGSDSQPESGNYFWVNNGTISYVSKDIKLSGIVTMNVDASGLTEGSDLNLYRGENGVPFAYKVTKLNAQLVTNVDTGDTFETAGNGTFKFQTTEDRGGDTLQFDVTKGTATFCVDDRTVAIKNGTVRLQSDVELYASGSTEYVSDGNVRVYLEVGGGVAGSGEVEVGVTEGNVTSIKGLDSGETVICGKTKFKAVDSTIIRTVTGDDGNNTVDKLTTDGATGDVDLLSKDNDSKWVSNKSPMGEVTLNLELTGSNQFWTLSGNEVTPVESLPDGTKNCFKLVDGELSYEPARFDDADEIITLGDDSKLTLTVKMAENANIFSVQDYLNKKVTSCEITGVDGATVTGFADGYTFTAKDLAEGNSVTINEQKFTMAASSTLELLGVNNTTENKARIANGAIKLEGEESTPVTYYSTVGSVIYDKEKDSTVELNGATVAFKDGEVTSITGIDVVGEIVTVKKAAGETTYGFDDIGIYKETSDSRAYYTGTETAGAVDVIKADTKDWSTGNDVTLTNPIIDITPTSDNISYYIVTAENDATGSKVTASKLETGKPTGAQNYFTVTNENDIYRLTYTKSAFNTINLSGTVTVALDGSNISGGGALELYHPEEGATFTYNVTNLKAHRVTNVTKGDTFETSEEGRRIMFETAGERQGFVEFEVTTKTTFCADESTVAVKSGTVNLYREFPLHASGSNATSSKDNVEVALTLDEDYGDGDGDYDYAVEVKVENGEVTSITKLDNGEIVTYGKNTTFKVVGSTIIKTVKETVDGKVTETRYRLTTTDEATNEVNLLAKTNTWVESQSTMGEVSFDFKLTGAEEQYWILSGNTLTVATKEETGAGTNFFKLSNGELSYTPAQNEDAEIISLGTGSKVTLKVDMSEGGETPKFSVDSDLEAYVTACNITGKNGATVTGFDTDYTFKATALEAGNFVTINEQKFTMAANGALELSGVKPANDESKALIKTGSIKLGVEGEESTNDYYSFDGSQVTYVEKQASGEVEPNEDPEEVEPEEGSEEVKPNGATVTFEDGAVSSITGIDVAGETVTFKNSKGETTTYGLDDVGLYKQTGPNDKAYYTGTVVDDDYGTVDVIGASKTKTDWTAYKEVILTNPTIAITPESGETSYYIVTATKTATGSRVTASKLKDGTVPTGTQNYFTLASAGGTYKLTYNTSDFNPINLSGNVTVNLNGSKLQSGGTFDLYHPQEGATFTYNVTALKGAAIFINVSSGDTFAAAGGTYGFAMVMKDDEVQYYSVTAASNFVADESAVAMYSGTATLDATYPELVASGKDKEATGDNVKVGFTAGEGNVGSKATVKVVNGEVKSITGLQDGDSVTFADKEKTETYLKTPTGFIRTIGEESEEYTGTIEDVITAISKDKEWYALGDVTFNDDVVLDLGTVTAGSFYKLTKITAEGATVVKATKPTDKENYFTVSSEGVVSYHQATGEGTTIATANASQATVKFAAQNLGILTLTGQGEENGVQNYEVSGVKKGAEVNGVANGDIIKTLGSATVNGFEYDSTAGALEIRGLAAEEDTEPDPETDPIINSNVGSEVAAKTALYSGTVNIIGTEDEDYTKTLTVGGADADVEPETVTITSGSDVTTKTGAVVTAKDGAITVIKDLENGETIVHDHIAGGSSVLDTYTYNGTSIIKTTTKDDETKTYAYDVAAAKNTNILTIKENQWLDVTNGIEAGEKIALTINLPATATTDGVFYKVTGSNPNNIKVDAKPSEEPFGSNYFRFFESASGTYSLEYNPAEDNTEGSFSIKLGNAKANINATAIADGYTLNLSNGGGDGDGGDGGYLPTYNVTGLRADAGVTSDNGVGFTLTTAALKKDNKIEIDGVTYTAGANGALKFEKDEGSVVFQSGTLKLASTGEAGVTARYVSTRDKVETTATIKSTAGEGTNGVLLTATAAGGLTVKDLEEGETVTIQVGADPEYTYYLRDGKLVRTKDGVISTYTGAAKFAATADVFAAINTDKWVETYEVNAFTSVLNLQPTGVNAVGKSAATYYRVVLEKDSGTNNMKVKEISTTPEYTVPTDANYFAVTATGAVTYHSNEYQKADLSGATVHVNYNTQPGAGAKFTTVARPKNAESNDNNVGSYVYTARAGVTFTGITQADSVQAILNNNEKVTVNGTAFTSAGANLQVLKVGITTNELKKEVAALKSKSTILVKGTYYVEIDEDGPYAKVVSTGNGVKVTFDENNDITSISGFDKNEKIEVYEPDDLNTKVEKIATYQVNAAGTMVIWTDSENHQQQAALVDGAITLSGDIWEDLAFAGSATLTLNDKTKDGTYGVGKKFLNSATAAASAISEGAEGQTTVGGVIIGNGNNSFTAADNFKGNVKITTSGTKTWELTGSKGNDTFTLGTATTLHGSNGNDTITSSAKEDTFDYTTGALTGEDMIKSFTSTAKVVDTIKVGGDAEFTLKGAGTNVELTIGDENGKKVSLVGMVGKEIDVAKGDENATAYIVGNDTKANTFTLTNAQLDEKTYSLIGGSANDTFKVANNSTAFLTLDLSEIAEDVEIFTAAGSNGAVDIIDAGTFVSITGGNAGDTIKAGENTKWISGGKGADSIDFGEDREDDATGIIYQLNAGDGKDTIANFKTKDKIYLGKGSITSVTSSDSGVIITAGKDSVLLKDVTDIKDIKNNLYTSAGKQISDAWYYNSGTVLPTGATFAGNTITLTTKFNGSSFDLTSITDFGGWVAASGNKSLDINGTAVKTALLIKGSDEDNIIKAGGKVGEVTSLNGAGGNDNLYGGAGTDVFIFEAGHGQDTVNNFINGKDMVSLSSSVNLEHTTNGANLTIDTGEGNSITLIGKANTRVDILDANDDVEVASDYSTAYYFGKSTGTNTYNVNAQDMLNAHFFGSDDAKDTLTITAKGASLSEGSALKEEDGYVKVDLTDATKFKSIDELNAQAVLVDLHVKSDSTAEAPTTIKAGKGNDSIECSAAGQDIIYYGGFGFGDDSISGFNAATDKLWVANTIKSVTALDNNGGVVIKFASGKNESTLTVMGDDLMVEALNDNNAVIASATAKANAASWTKAYNTYIADLK